MIVYLVRHTSVVWDGSVVCYGATDIDVRDTFVEEATACRERLEGIEVEQVYSSPLQRASKLANFCGYEDAERDDRLKEMDFGAWEGLLWQDIIKDEPTEEFFQRYITQRTPGGESQEDQFERVKAFILEKKAEGKQSILIFCHGGVINCARTLAGLVPLNEAFATIPDFGSLTRLEF